MTWHSEAEQELIRIWLKVEDRQAISQATSQIDQSLAVDVKHQTSDLERATLHPHP